MGGASPTERDWYGIHWKTLRSNLIKACVRHSADFLEILKSDAADIDRASALFVDEMLKRIATWIPEDRLGLWKNALPLLSNKADFITRVERDIDALTGTKVRNEKVISDKQALGRLLWQHFEVARRSLEAMDRDISAARIKTWERLDRISRRLTATLPIIETRCSEEHFLMLSTYVKEHHQHDRNLPRRPAKIREYFYEFSGSCLDIGIPDDLGGWDHYVEEDWEHDSPSQEANLASALGTLSDLERACLDLQFGTTLSSTTCISKHAFMTNNALNADAYQALLANVLERARPLIEAMASKEFGGFDDE